MMDVSALNLGSATLPDEAATAPGVGPAGDLFAKLLSGLGLAPTAGEGGDPTVKAAQATPPGEVTPPIDPALVLVRSVAGAGKSRGETVAPSDGAAEAEAPLDAEAGATPTTASLGLPPLLAALVAPTLIQAAPSAVPASGQAVGSEAPQPAAGAVPGAADMPPAGLVIAAQIGASTAAQVKPQAKDEAKAPATELDPQLPAAIPAAGPSMAQPESAPVVLAQPMPTLRRLAQAQPDLIKGTATEAEPGKKGTIPVSPVAAMPATVTPLPEAAAAAPVEARPVEAVAADQVVDRQLDLAQDGEWLDQLARDIVRTAGSEGALRFKLNPETLGSLHVEVTQGQAGASVRLTADTEQARAIIADARPQLIAEARAQGVRIAEAHVDLGGQGQPQGQSQPGQGGRDGRELPGQPYLTSWKPESAEEKATPSQRSTAERYA